MANPPCRSICLAALFCISAGDAAAAAWQVEAAAGVTLLWIGTLATACCVLRRRCRAAESRLRETTAALHAEQRARGQAELALSELHDGMALLVQQQAAVRDDERGRIARDLHDDLGQTLLTARIDVSLLQVATKGLHTAANDKLAHLGSSLDAALRALRTAINNLRPLALGEGLRGALQRQVREFARLSGITCEYAAEDSAIEAAQREPLLDVVLYRIVQEALSNAARHSHASLVRVSLRCVDGSVALDIQDNGIGMNADPATYGSGLSGLRQRISAAGGQFMVESGAREGTLLAVALPLAHESVAR
ncbi:hypothetical protein GCM10027321_01630 [Massilia terrae]|uniref:Oxygen sensor histidine kinase NreB n=1 Tax=Massilia terrae TaxID=1811224 RepID=A0ABT2CUK1_9BURK|nr:sensor histidine kinase [Massilia terrae]MCS0657475.1 sensor histidine kinase [Massilia terrae]